MHPNCTILPILLGINTSRYSLSPIALTSMVASFSYYFLFHFMQSDVIRNVCCCPSLLIVIAGPWICVLGAVFIGTPVVQPLTPFLSMLPTPPDDSPIAYFARLFVALGRAFHSLNGFYQGLVTSGVRDIQRYFPHFHDFQSVHGKHVYFRYVTRLTPLTQPLRLVYQAKTMDGALIVVKFVPHHRYNKAAHELCAAAGLAPQLLHYGGQSSTFRVVVMPYVEHTPLRCAALDAAVRRTVYGEVEKVIELLHAHDFVFADLREPNILVVEGNTRAMLVDFDWCGTEYTTTYPLSMNTIDIGWPEGVWAGAPLRKAHDLAWLERLKKDLRLD